MNPNRFFSALVVCLAAVAIGTNGCATPAAPSPVLDQQNLLDGDLGGQAIGRFSDLSGAPDPAGTSFDLQDAQTFTVGIAGHLNQIKLPIINGEGGTLPVVLEMRAVSGGVPDSNDATGLGAVSLPASALPTSFGIVATPSAWATFDVSGLNIVVSVGQVLAFSVRTLDSKGFSLPPEFSLGYAAGTFSRRNRALAAGWTQFSAFDLGFQIYIKP